MEKTLVSIIVPVYNVEKRLARCIESLCGQSYKDIEILLLDDGSTDGSAAICSAAAEKDSRIRFIHKPNSGVSDTRNLGLELATGKYLQFVDSDDCITPDYTQQLVAAAERTNAELVIAPYQLQFEPDVKGCVDARTNGFLPACTLTQKQFVRALLKGNSTFYYGALWNKLYRRDLTEGLQFIKLPFGEDMEFNVRYAARISGVVCAIDEPGYCYIQSRDSLCHSKINAKTVIQVKRYMYPLFKTLAKQVGLEKECRADILSYLVSFSESNMPSGAIQKAMDAISGTTHASRMLAASKRIKQHN